jgi:DNA-binding HxlR family transcriptional regulator
MIDFEKLDKTIHEKARLSIMTLLATRPSWTFQDLKTELKMSDGNLITHLRVLHEAGYVAVTKEILDRPQTSYSLTTRGRTAFQDYLSILEQIVKATQVLKKFTEILCHTKPHHDHQTRRTLWPLLRRPRRHRPGRTSLPAGATYHSRRTRP